MNTMNDRSDSDRTTPPRNQHAKRVVELYHQSMAVRTKRQLFYLQEALWSLVLNELEPRQREAYELICQCADTGTALVPVVDVAEALDMSDEAASINLKSLVDMGLLERVKMTEDKRTWYEYGLPGTVQSVE